MATESSFLFGVFKVSALRHPQTQGMIPDINLHYFIIYWNELQQVKCRGVHFRIRNHPFCDHFTRCSL